jgi:hypothetical protein
MGIIPETGRREIKNQAKLKKNIGNIFFFLNNIIPKETNKATNNITQGLKNEMMIREGREYIKSLGKKSTKI